VAMSVDW
jgi:hypothetical protein